MTARRAEPGGVTIPLHLPQGAITIAAPPALFGAACAEYLGMTPEQARRVLTDMSKDRTFAVRVVVLSRRPRELAAPPDEVLRYLRARCPAAEPETPSGTPANDSGEESEEDKLAREMGLTRQKKKAA